jgi:hypothetical protein
VLAEKLRGWRAAREIHATNASQDFLVRAWRKTKFLVCVPHVTALILSSGGRPGSYVRRDGSQHAAVFAAMENQRPTLVVVPPGVFHGVKALGSQPAMLINMVDQAYAYDDPDHWRLPEDAREIPYRFSS